MRIGESLQPSTASVSPRVCNLPTYSFVVAGHTRSSRNRSSGNHRHTGTKWRGNKLANDLSPSGHGIQHFANKKKGKMFERMVILKVFHAKKITASRLTGQSWDLPTLPCVIETWSSGQAMVIYNGVRVCFVSCGFAVARDREDREVERQSGFRSLPRFGTCDKRHIFNFCERTEGCNSTPQIENQRKNGLQLRSI